MPVKLGAFRQTLRELKSTFSGFSVSLCIGWCTEDAIWDIHLCVESDLELTREMESYLICWQEILQDRFAQRSIHMSLSGPVTWIRRAVAADEVPSLSTLF
jgi:hypothetical protein